MDHLKPVPWSVDLERFFTVYNNRFTHLFTSHVSASIGTPWRQPFCLSLPGSPPATSSTRPHSPAAFDSGIPGRGSQTPGPRRLISWSSRCTAYQTPKNTNKKGHKRIVEYALAESV